MRGYAVFVAGYRPGAPLSARSRTRFVQLPVASKSPAFSCGRSCRQGMRGSFAKGVDVRTLRVAWLSMCAATQKTNVVQASTLGRRGMGVRAAGCAPVVCRAIQCHRQPRPPSRCDTQPWTASTRPRHSHPSPLTSESTARY